MSRVTRRSGWSGAPRRPATGGLEDEVQRLGSPILEHRLRCPTCLAVFRTGFQCCPSDGAALVPWEGDPLIGTEVAGRYVIDALVGEGSMGLIYRAHHVNLPRRFAVKILFGDLIADPRMRIRFAQEAALASRLSHPNVVSVVDFGRGVSGLLYMVMDYVEGEPLSDLIAREAPLEPLFAVRIARQLARGLGHAHKHGLVHRDFKPGNVLLERHEDDLLVPRILDFGLAISTHEREEMSGRLTEGGYIIGTPVYIAPEQVLDLAVDHRADLFALGVVLYEMLAGQAPFDGRPVEIAHKNVVQPVPPIIQRSGIQVDLDLERVVRRLLAKSPVDRFGSADELCAALEALEHREAEQDRLLLVEPVGDGDEEIEQDTDNDIERPRLVWAPWRLLAVGGACLFMSAAVAYALAMRADHARKADLEPALLASAPAPKPAEPPQAYRRAMPMADPPRTQTLREPGEESGINQARVALPRRREVDTHGVVPHTPPRHDMPERATVPRELLSRSGGSHSGSSRSEASRSGRKEGGDPSGGERRQTKQAEKAVPEGMAAVETAAPTEVPVASFVERAMLPAREVPSPPLAGSASRVGLSSVGDDRDRRLSAPLPATQAEPARTSPDTPASPRKPIVVPPYRTRRESGSLPPIQFPRWETAPSQIAAKMCIDASGRVTSVQVLTHVSRMVSATLEQALSTWRYRPVLDGSEPVAACFATSFRVEVE